MYFCNNLAGELREQIVGELKWGKIKKILFSQIVSYVNDGDHKSVLKDSLSASLDSDYEQNYYTKFNMYLCE